MQNQPQLKLSHWDKSINFLEYGIVWAGDTAYLVSKSPSGELGRSQIDC